MCHIANNLGAMWAIGMFVIYGSYKEPLIGSYQKITTYVCTWNTAKYHDISHQNIVHHYLK